MSVTAQKYWRLRRGEHYIDAELLRDADDAVELRFSYDGRLVQSRRWTEAEAALAAAASTRRDLERAGWIHHW